MRTRRARRNRRNRRTRRRSYRNIKPSQRGGLGQAYSIPDHAVISAGFHEPDNTYPVLMEYGAYREALDNPIFGVEETGQPVKLNEANNILPYNENAESSGRKEIQVQQALTGVEGNSSSRRRRSANRSHS